MNLFEEINFFKDNEEFILLPIYLTLLNVPSILFEIFPFIFLISTQFFYLDLIDKNELLVFKNHGINNFSILKVLVIISALIALMINIVFYNVLILI